MMSKQQFLFLTAGVLLLASCVDTRQAAPSPSGGGAACRAPRRRSTGRRLRRSRDARSPGEAGRRASRGQEGTRRRWRRRNRSQFSPVRRRGDRAATELAVAQGTRCQNAGGHCCNRKQQLGMVHGSGGGGEHQTWRPAIVPPPEELEPSGPPALPPRTSDSPGTGFSGTIPTGPPPADRLMIRREHVHEPKYPCNTLEKLGLPRFPCAAVLTLGYRGARRHGPAAILGCGFHRHRRKSRRSGIEGAAGLEQGGSESRTGAPARRALRPCRPGPGACEPRHRRHRRGPKGPESARTAPWEAPIAEHFLFLADQQVQLAQTLAQKCGDRGSIPATGRSTRPVAERP